MYIGIDLGGTNIAAGLVDEMGQVLFKHSVPTKPERGAAAIVEDMAALVRHFEEKAEDPSEIKGIGIGIPGISNPHNGNVLACVNLGWYDFPLMELLASHTSLPIFISNDATVAAVAELEVSEMGKYHNAVMLTLGTGVGGGVMMDGHMVHGHHGIASEIGHMKVGDGLYQCGCGTFGCLETFCSSKAIIHYANHLLETTEQASVLRSIPSSDIDGEKIFTAAKAGDALADKVVERMVKYLSIGIINVISVVDPEVVLLGGGLSMAGEYLLNRVRVETEKLKFFKSAPIADIHLAKLQNDAGIIGAALYAKLELETQ